jgi:hypothetical protein
LGGVRNANIEHRSENAGMQILNIEQGILNIELKMRNASDVQDGTNIEY